MTLVDVGADGLDRLDGEAALEEREAVAHQPGVRGEPVVAPADRRRHRALPLRHRLRAGGEQVEAAAQPVDDAVEAAQLDPRRGQLEGERAGRRAARRPRRRRAPGRRGRKVGSADVARSTKSRTDGAAAMLARSAAMPGHVERQVRAVDARRSTRSGSRLVTSRVRAADASSSRRTTSGPPARASRLSSTTRTRAARVEPGQRLGRIAVTGQPSASATSTSSWSPPIPSVTWRKTTSANGSCTSAGDQRRDPGLAAAADAGQRDQPDVAVGRASSATSAHRSSRPKVEDASTGIRARRRGCTGCRLARGRRRAPGRCAGCRPRAAGAPRPARCRARRRGCRAPRRTP